MQPQVPQAQPGTIPAYNAVDETVVEESYQQHKDAMNRMKSGGINFLKFPGPGGSDWGSGTPIGFESTLTVYIAPPWAPGKNIFKPSLSHFWKSTASPRGISIGCGGPAVCLVCQARDAAFNGTDGAMKERAKTIGRVRKQFLYNVVLMDNFPGHFDGAGVMRPFILGAGSQLHKAIGDLVEGRGGAVNIVDPWRGRPLRLKRRKTGPENMDVEYSALDMDPMPLPVEFYPVLQNLYDLDTLDKVATHEDMVRAVNEMGFPIPAGVPLVGAQPAYPNPYRPPAQVGTPSSPVYMPPPGMQVDPVMPPPVSSNPTQNAYQPQPSQQVPVYNPPTPMGAPNIQTGAPVGASSLQMMPPPSTYPAPYNQPLRQPVTGGPQAAPPAPAPPVVQPGTQPAVQGLPGGRERCFGKFNGEDNLCRECPPEILGQCQQVASVVSPQQTGAPAQTMEQLQSQLASK